MSDNSSGLLNVQDARTAIINLLKGKEEGSNEKGEIIRGQCAHHRNQDSDPNCTYNIYQADGGYLTYAFHAICHSKNCDSEKILLALKDMGIATRLEIKSGGKRSAIATQHGGEGFKEVAIEEYLTVGDNKRYNVRLENDKGEKKFYQTGATKEMAYIKPFPATDKDAERFNELFEKMFEEPAWLDNPQPDPDRSPNPLVICEGEKAARSLQSKNFNAVTWIAGAQQVKRSEWKPIKAYAKKFDIIVWPDDDEEGRTAATFIVQYLRKEQIPFKAIETDGDTHKDAADYSIDATTKMLFEALPDKQLTQHKNPRGAPKINPFSENPIRDLAEYCADTGNFAKISSIIHHYENNRNIWTPCIDTDTISQVCIRPEYLWGAKLEMERGFNYTVGRSLRGIMNADTEQFPETNAASPYLWPLKEEVFDAERGIMREYKKEDFFTERLDWSIDFDEKRPNIIKLPKKMLKVLTEGLIEDVKDEELEFDHIEDISGIVLDACKVLAYLVFTKNRGQHFFSFYGTSGSGKGVIDRMLEYLIGYKRVMTLDEQMIREGKPWAFAGGERMRLMSIKDLTGHFPADKLKKLTGEDRISCAYKNQNAYEYKYDGHLVVYSNKKFNIDDEGVRRRFIALPFIGKPKIKDTNMTKKVRSETGIIFRFLYSYWGKKLIKDEIEGRDFEVPETLQEASKEFAANEISTSQFFIERINIGGDKNSATKTSDIVEAYIEWCGISGDKNSERAAARIRRYLSDSHVSIGLRKAKHGYWCCQIRPEVSEETLPPAEPETAEGELF